MRLLLIAVLLLGGSAFAKSKGASHSTRRVVVKKTTHVRHHAKSHQTKATSPRNGT